MEIIHGMAKKNNKMYDCFNAIICGVVWEIKTSISFEALFNEIQSPLKFLYNTYCFLVSEITCAAKSANFAV